MDPTKTINTVLTTVVMLSPGLVQLPPAPSRKVPKPQAAVDDLPEVARHITTIDPAGAPPLARCCSLSYQACSCSASSRRPLRPPRLAPSSCCSSSTPPPLFTSRARQCGRPVRLWQMRRRIGVSR
jgi:hypothetical protein